VVSFVAGIAFLLMGAWPVFGFFGLDVLAIYWAFRIYFRRAKACEEIRVTPSELHVRRVSHRGHVVEFTFTRCGFSSTARRTPNLASSGSIWSRKAAESPSPASSARRKRKAFPKT